MNNKQMEDKNYNDFIQENEKVYLIYQMEELKELYEIRRLGCYIDRTLSSVLLLFHDNKRYDLNSLLTQETRTKIMNIIYD